MVCLSKLLSPPHLVSVSDRLFLILRNILTIFIYSTGDVLMSNSFQCWLYHKVYNGLSVLSPFVGIFWRKLTEVYLRERRHCLTKVKCFLTSLILKLWWRCEDEGDDADDHHHGDEGDEDQDENDVGDDGDDHHQQTLCTNSGYFVSKFKICLELLLTTFLSD